MTATATKDQIVTTHVQASDARLIAEALSELRRGWLDEADEARRIGDTEGMHFSQMRADAADRVAGQLHGAGWDPTR